MFCGCKLFVFVSDEGEEAGTEEETEEEEEEQKPAKIKFNKGWLMCDHHSHIYVIIIHVQNLCTISDRSTAHTCIITHS